MGKDSPICRIVVPVEYRNDVMAGLRACGIAETSVYPDLDGLAKELVTEYGGARPAEKGRPPSAKAQNENP